MVDTIDTEYIELTATTGSDLDPELAAWFDEAIRALRDEAWGRVG